MKGRKRRKFFISVRSVRIIWRVFVNITGECESIVLHTHKEFRLKKSQEAQN